MSKVYMMSIPTIQAENLVLRPFVPSDCNRVQLMASDERLAKYTRLPHPYPEGCAAQWISEHSRLFEEHRCIPLAIERLSDHLLIGATSLLSMELNASRAEIGYWIGVEYWGKGYCTEAARELIRYGFKVLGLNRIYSSHAAPNVASGRVLQKAGLRKEGVLRQHEYRGGQLVDMVCYGLLACEFNNARS